VCVYNYIPIKFQIQNLWMVKTSVSHHIFMT
jgi:hypothetical protein